MNNEIRQAHSLSEELETQIFDLQDKAWEFLEESNVEKALEKIQEAWDLIPEPKFNTSCSHIILCDLVGILNVNSKHIEAKQILEDWISDLENSGYKIYETAPFVLFGETFLFLNNPENAKEQFYKAVKYGAGKRDFSDKPSFYFEIAQKKIIDNDKILELFSSKNLEKINVNPEISEDISEKIEELSEQGNEYYDDENYEKAIVVWNEALALIPQPQNTFSESLWLESSIGDAYFMENKHADSFIHFMNAKNNLEENAYENPFIMLRLGQLYLEQNDTENAKEFLLRAYMLEGEEIFEGSKEKYFEFLKENVKL